MNSAPLPLKPLHTPPDISAWPPALGWWLLLGVLLLLAALLWRHWRKQRLRSAPNHWLTDQLHALFAQNLAPHQTAEQTNRLLKRWALSQGAKPGLQGEQWLAFLQQCYPRPLDIHLREFLTRQAYQPAPLLDTSAMAQLKVSLFDFARIAQNQEPAGV